MRRCDHTRRTAPAPPEPRRWKQRCVGSHEGRGSTRMLKNAEALAEDLPMSLLGKRAKGPSAPSHSSRDAAPPDLDFVVTPTKSGESSSKSESNVPSAVRTASPRRHARARAKVNVL